jgi:Protein of unknown function (DUF3551)
MPKEALMRILALAILTIGMVSIGPAGAQTYDPAYPVCLRVYDRTNYYECRYTSLPQCAASASAARHSASPIRISRARKSLRVIGGIAESTKVDRIGRQTAYAMLVILALAIVWQVLRSL